MELFLLRHGPAESPHGFATDAARPLSSEGRALMRAAAPSIAHVIGATAEIITSPLLRARETEALVQQALAREIPTRLSDLLTPDTPLSDALALLDSFDAHRAYLLISHQPLISGVAGALLGATSSAIEFNPGTLVHLELFGAGNPAVLRASLPPHLLATLSQGTARIRRARI